MMIETETFSELARYRVGDMIAIYHIHNELKRVQLQIIPHQLDGKIQQHRKYLDRPEGSTLKEYVPKSAWELDSLVQIRLADDPCVSAFANGRSMRNSSATLGLKFESQRHENFEIVTVLSNERGFKCEHILGYGNEQKALSIFTRFLNCSSEPLTVEMMASFSMGGITPFARDEAPGRLQFHRARSYWAGEGRIESLSLEQLHMVPSYTAYGVTSERFGQVGSMPTRGFFPFAAIEDTKQGVVWASQLAWNGSWQMEVYRQDDFVQLSGGLADREFGHWWKMVLPKEELVTPKAFVTVVEGHLDEACQRLTSIHQFDAPMVEEDLPIIFNEWCTTWGHPNHDNVVALADRLVGSGVKYLVIDDGWAERPTERMQENGDWIVASKKFPLGLKATCDAIRQRGMIPGIWFEFEVANKGSEAWLKTEHHLHRDGRIINVGSRRFWNFCDPWVHEFLTERVIGLIKNAGLGYMKVDYNETIGIGCDGKESIGEGLRQHLLGLRAFFKKIRQECPDLVIEICSSGGMRLEPSMLELGSMFSFSDAHETLDIPILAYNVQRLVPARANQIWAVLRAEDSSDRLVYSLACTFYGRMCLSGDIYKLSAQQWQIAQDAQSLYKKVAPIIAHGHSIKFGPDQQSYRHPVGWQALLRLDIHQSSAMVICHTFKNSPSKGIKIHLPEGQWSIEELFHSNQQEPSITSNELILAPICTKSYAQPGNHSLYRGNSTIIGWEGDKDAAIAKENGWFFIRDGEETLATFIVSAYPEPGKFKWYPHSGYLPCFITEFQEKKCLVKIANFADKVTIDNFDFVIAYSRVTIQNPTTDSIQISPGASAVLIPLNNRISKVVDAGETVLYDYATVIDRFGNNYKKPSSEAIIAAGGWDKHFQHMKTFWESQLAKIVSINTPDEELNNAYRMGFIYTLITKDGSVHYNTGEFGYDIMYNHDYLGILTTLFKLGFYDNAHEQLKIVGQGVGNYHDQFYRWSLPLSIYLQKTGDLDVLNIEDGLIFKKCTEAFDKTLNDLDPINGILKPTWDIDDEGLWTWDNESALTGLACYKYVAQKHGNLMELKKSEAAYDALLKNINRRLIEMTTEHRIDYIPASLELPNEKLPNVMAKGSSFWATPFWFGMNWDTYLAGGHYEGPLLDRIDATYQWGFSKMKSEGFDPHNIGTWVNYGGGISSCYNAAFCISGLLSKEHRQEAIKAYQFMLEYGQSAPYGFWEMFQAPSKINVWSGTHPGLDGNWYCCPHQWGQAGATQALLDALVVEFYDGRILIGRGYLDEWCQAGKVTEINNFPIRDNRRLNIRIEFMTSTQVKLTISGADPAFKTLFSLPIFVDNIESTTTGALDNKEGTVTLVPKQKQVIVRLKNAAPTPSRDQ
jgi:alpha-galactosidase